MDITLSLSFFVCLSLSFSVLPLTNIYLFLSQFCLLMTRVVLLFEGADGSPVSHILRKRRGGWDTGGRVQDKQCRRPPIWMKATSLWTAFHRQQKAGEAALYMPWLYVTVVWLCICPPVIYKRATFTVVLYYCIFIWPISVKGLGSRPSNFPAVPTSHEWDHIRTTVCTVYEIM